MDIRTLSVTPHTVTGWLRKSQNGAQSMKTAEMMVAKWFVLVIHMKGIGLLLYAMAAGLVTIGKMVSLNTHLYRLGLDTKIFNIYL